MHNYEWEIFYNNEVVGYLTDPFDPDYFWCHYKVISKPGYESIVYDPKNWDYLKFKYFNVFRQEFAAIAMPGEFEDIAKSATVNMRSLYYFKADIRNAKIIDIYIPLVIIVVTLCFVIVYSYIKFHGK